MSRCFLTIVLLVVPVWHLCLAIVCLRLEAAAVLKLGEEVLCILPLFLYHCYLFHSFLWPLSWVHAWALTGRCIHLAQVCRGYFHVAKTSALFPVLLLFSLPAAFHPVDPVLFSSALSIFHPEPLCCHTCHRPFFQAPRISSFSASPLVWCSPSSLLNAKLSTKLSLRELVPCLQVMFLCIGAQISVSRS